jgi:lipid-A-disaccharide synthase-like uncharacterized protein
MTLSLSTPTIWLIVGFTGQAIFTGRFLVQWVASERRRDSVVPVAFWWLSLAGGLTLLSYALYKEDPVIIVGQSMGAFIYIRNLMLVQKGRQRAERQAARAAAALAAPGPELAKAGTTAARAGGDGASTPLPAASGAIPRPHLNAHANGHARRENNAPGPRD